MTIFPTDSVSKGNDGTIAPTSFESERSGLRGVSRTARCRHFDSGEQEAPMDPMNHIIPPEACVPASAPAYATTSLLKPPGKT